MCPAPELARGPHAFLGLVAQPMHKIFNFKSWSVLDIGLYHPAVVNLDIPKHLLKNENESPEVGNLVNDKVCHVLSKYLQARGFALPFACIGSPKSVK